MGAASARNPSAQPAAADRSRGLRVIVVDDHAAVREGIRAWLGSEPDIDPVATAATARDALALAHRMHPEVMVLDYHLPDEDGLSLSLRLKSTPSPPATLIYSSFADQQLFALAVIAGADAVMSKGGDPAELCDLVRALARGTQRLPPIAPRAMESAASQLEVEDLPIFGMLVHRTPPAEIAATLGMDEAWLTTRRWAMLKRFTGDSAGSGSPRGGRESARRRRSRRLLGGQA